MNTVQRYYLLLLLYIITYYNQVYSVKTNSRHFVTRTWLRYVRG